MYIHMALVTERIPSRHGTIKNILRTLAYTGSEQEHINFRIFSKVNRHFEVMYGDNCDVIGPAVMGEERVTRDVEGEKMEGGCGTGLGDGANPKWLRPGHMIKI